jgi:hypothetical protein
MGLTMSEGREMGVYREKLFGGWGFERLVHLLEGILLGLPGGYFYIVPIVTKILHPPFGCFYLFF